MQNDILNKNYRDEIEVNFNLPAALLNFFITLVLSFLNGLYLYFMGILIFSDDGIKGMPTEVIVIFAFLTFPSIALGFIMYFQPTIIASNINTNNFKRNPFSIFRRFFSL